MFILQLIPVLAELTTWEDGSFVISITGPMQETLRLMTGCFPNQLCQ